MVYDRLILGSSGNEPPPGNADAEVFYRKHWRWLETNDRNWEHMTPIQGDWTISSIGLPAPVLRKIYFDNARKLLARSLPPPIAHARRMARDFAPDGDLAKPIWQTAQPTWLEYAAKDGAAHPALATQVRMLWTDTHLYLGFECPFTRLSVFEPPRQDGERFGMNQRGVSLWDRDVVEVFLNADANDPKHYSEFQVAPSNERLDLKLRLPDRDFAWSSGFQSAVRVDEQRKLWSCELRIPLPALSETKPKPGTRWRVNLFRCDLANQAALAWNPTLGGSFHVPGRFGILEFTE
jgi:hypothetical protein